MAALMLEGALGDVMTLNFDLAASHALADLAVGTSISVVRGPDHHTQLSTKNLIYLHRDIDSDYDDLILRTDALADAWRDQWEQILAQRVLASATVVFVGLGSPASVLVETTNRILAARNGAIGNVFVVDPSDYADSRFAEALGIPPDNYICMGWGEFMDVLSRRLVEEHRVAMVQDCQHLVSENAIETENVSHICQHFAEAGILRLGQIRASWLLQTTPYLPNVGELTLRHFCDLILGISMLERLSGREASVSADGIVEFISDGYPTNAMVCSGRGWMSAAKIEAEILRRRRALQPLSRPLSFALVSAVASGPELAPPDNVTSQADPNDLVTGPGELRIFNLAHLRSDPSLVDEVFK